MSAAERGRVRVETGTKRVRAVDPDWPKPGSSLHFTAGLGLVVHDDRTTVSAYRAGEHLELEAHLGPLGSARIAIDLVADGDGTRLAFDEHPLRGPIGRVHNPVLDALLWARAQFMLRRFKHLVEEGASVNGQARAASVEFA